MIEKLPLLSRLLYSEIHGLVPMVSIWNLVITHVQSNPSSSLKGSEREEPGYSRLAAFLRGRHRRRASTGDRAPDPCSPARDGAAGARHRAWAAQPQPPPGALGVAPRSAPTRAGRADRTRRSPSFLSRADAGELAGWREEAPGAAHIRAPRASVWPPRSDVDPPAPDLNRPRSLACPPPRESPLPPARRTETHPLPPPSRSEPPPPAASRPRSPPGPGAAGPGKSAFLGRQAGAGCGDPRCRQSRRSCPRRDRSRYRATRSRDEAVALPRLGGRTRCRPTAARAQDIGGSGDTEGLPALSTRSTFSSLGRSAPLSHSVRRLILTADVGGEGLRLYLDGDAIETSHLLNWRFPPLGGFVCVFVNFLSLQFPAVRVLADAKVLET
nr:serine/arginine repetitive matrix protein 1-like [Kogia breviceps]